MRAFKNNVRIPSYDFVFSSNTVHPVTLSNKKDRQLRQDILASTLCYEPAFRSTRTIHYRIQVTVPISVHLITWKHEEEKTQGILEDETKKLCGQQQGIKGLGKLKTMHRIVRVGLHSQILQVGALGPYQQSIPLKRLNHAGQAPVAHSKRAFDSRASRATQS